MRMRYWHLKMAASSEVVTEAILEDKFVELWQDFPCLYDIRSTEFKDRDKRESAIKKTATALEQTEAWVKAKIRALRSSYTKAKKGSPSGSARKFSKRTKWLLEKLQFLEPYVTTRPSVSNLDTAFEADDIDIEAGDDSLVEDDGESFVDLMEDDDREDQQQPQDNNRPKSTKQPLKKNLSNRSRKRQADEEYELIKGLTKSLSDKTEKRQNGGVKKNTVDSFSLYVSETLSELDTRTRHLARHKINEILFQAQSGTLIYSNQNVQNQPPYFSQSFQQQDQTPPYTNMWLSQSNNMGMTHHFNSRTSSVRSSTPSESQDTSVDSSKFFNL